MTLAVLAFAWLLGIAVASFSGADPAATLAAAGLLAVVSFALRPRFGTLALIAAGCVLVFAAGWRYETTVPEPSPIARFNEGDSVRLRAVVSDEGTDLKRAMEFFHRDHPAVRHQHDLKHKNALLLKKELEGDGRWGEFVKEANRTKLGTTQTSLAFLNPPGLKTKARYMNLDTLVSWGVRTLNYLDAGRTVADPAVDHRKVQEKLGWLRSYRQDLKRWSELLKVAQTTEKAVQGGVHPLICDELRPQLRRQAMTPAAQRMSRNILAFLKTQSSDMQADERLIGSSEVLESIIGRYKRLQSCHSKGGMTAMLLSIGAMIGQKTRLTIVNALQQIRTVDVHKWCQEHLGRTLQSQRRLVLRATKTG